MAEILKGLEPDARPLSIPLVVLTLTCEQLHEISPDRLQWIETDYGVSLSDLALQYGSTRDDWRPLAGKEAITDLLANVRIEIENAIPRRHVAWREPDDEFWARPAVVSRFVKADFLSGELSLLIVDPVAIYHPDIFHRLVCFQDCFANPHMVIVVLPPYSVPRRIAAIKHALGNQGTPCFDDYFRPSVPPKRRLAAQFVWNAIDGDDIRRHLLMAASDLVMKPAASRRSSFIRQGAPR
ncbi:hypothetical protein [uncultured Thiodictyon sp.]|uniref:hypothetical protein n=1 Tax=uncultured Thiodictyon sp. TaxID=1846217 RepID=UPI0025E7F57C|nr:hypothetical protein [uncultured Thiodictyon sp.]